MEASWNQNAARNKTESKQNKTENPLIGLKKFIAPIAAALVVNFGLQADTAKNYTLTDTNSTHQELTQKIQIEKSTDHQIQTASQTIKDIVQNSLNLNQSKDGESLFEKSENFVKNLEKILSSLSGVMLVLKLITTKNVIKNVGTKKEGEVITATDMVGNIPDTLNWLGQNVIDLYSQPDKFLFNTINVIENSAGLLSDLAILVKIKSGKGRGENINLSNVKESISAIKSSLGETAASSYNKSLEFLPYLDEYRKKFPGELEKFIEEMMNNPAQHTSETWNNGIDSISSKLKQILPGSKSEQFDRVTLILLITGMVFHVGLLPQIISTVKDFLYTFKVINSRNSSVVNDLPKIISNASEATQEFSIYSVYGIFQLVASVSALGLKGITESKPDLIEGLKSQVDNLLKRNGKDNKSTSKPHQENPPQKVIGVPTQTFRQGDPFGLAEIL